MKALECESPNEGANLLYQIKGMRPVSFSEFIKWLEEQEREGNKDSEKIIKYLKWQGLVKIKTS